MLDWFKQTVKTKQVFFQRSSGKFLGNIAQLPWPQNELYVNKNRDMLPSPVPVPAHLSWAELALLLFPPVPAI